MKLLYKVLFTTFLFPLFSIAQGNYKPGYVLTLKGDSIPGFIDYKDWGQNPKLVNFKKDINQKKSETYSAADVREFAVTGFELYRQFSGRISQDLVSVNYLKTAADTSTKFDIVFLKTILLGKNVNLYKYTDNKKTRYFISENGGQPTELNYHKHLADGNTVAIDAIYINQLQRLAGIYQPQNAALSREIETSNYYLSDLKNIIAQLNGSTTNNLFGLAKQNNSSRIYLGLYVNDTFSHFSGDNELTAAKTVANFSPALNLGIDVFINKNVRTLIFRLNLGFTTNNLNINYAGNQHSDVFNLKQYIVTLNPQILYNVYNTKAVKLYGSLGVGVNFATSSVQYYYLYNNPGTPAYTNDMQSTPLKYDAQPFYFSPTAKLGVVLNSRLDINIGYSSAVFGGNHVSYSTASTTLGAGINYLFGH
jgi:hypothetical protein